MALFPIGTFSLSRRLIKTPCPNSLSGLASSPQDLQAPHRDLLPHGLAPNRDLLLVKAPHQDALSKLLVRTCKLPSRLVEIQVRKIYCINRAVSTLPINIEDEARKRCRD
ncbi:hypothetical protein SOVF_095920 [Spinacia oleracea]|nr:hypothetical protein SOVF_095920 [Spinacia oleracea]